MTKTLIDELLYDEYEKDLINSENYFSFYNTYLIKENSKNLKAIKQDAKTYIGDPNKEKHLKIVRDLIFKVDNHIERYNLNVSRIYVMNSISDSDLVASMFAISATKQSASEKSQLLWMKHKGIDLYNLSTKEFLIKNAKSADFQSNTFDNRYFIAKVISGHGGAQDNQNDDVLKTLNALHNPIYREHEFIVLADGDYYTEEKIAELKREAPRNTTITNSDDYLEN